MLERTDLELHDEVPPDAADAPPDEPPETAPLEHVPATPRPDDDPPADWGRPPTGRSSSDTRPGPRRSTAAAARTSRKEPQ